MPGISRPMTRIDEVFGQHETLLTGANGFLGKVLLGLILDRLPDFKHLHLLVRPGRGASASERFYGETLASPALSTLVQKLAERRGRDFLRDRITVWAGDISKPHCGINPHDLERLVGRIGLILNCAGTVEFFPPVDESFRTNVDGVENVVAMSKSLRAKLLHVSTCYVCGEAEGLVEETEPIVGFYPRRKGPADTRFQHHEELRYCRERIGEIYDSACGSLGHSRRPGDRSGAERRAADVAQRLAILGEQRAAHWGWVNTYTYAKSLGEQIIAAEKHLDYAIVRPAIVESALRFPFPGWIEKGRTAAPLVLMALGGLKDWPIRKDLPLEVVPVHSVASALLVVAALLLHGRHERVYQLGTADVNPIELEQLVTLLDAESRRQAHQRESSSLGQSLLHRWVSASHTSPVRFISSDQARTRRTQLERRIRRAEGMITGTRWVLDKTGLPGKRSLARWNDSLRKLGLQAKFREQTLEQYAPFILQNRYVFESENIRAAYSMIAEGDRELLPWHPERIDWKHYWVNHQIPGIQKWVQSAAVRAWSFKL